MSPAESTPKSKSTGPRTPEGKKTSAINALRHGAQTFCDTQWRLNRIRAIEDSLLALGHYESAGVFNPGHPEVHAAFTSAKVFRQNPNVFANLSLYEQRLQRTLKESLRQLRELQAERRASRQAALDEAIALRNLARMKGEAAENKADHSSGQFVFSPPLTAAEIEAESLRQTRLAQARKARSVGFNRAQYEKSPLAQAA